MRSKKCKCGGLVRDGKCSRCKLDTYDKQRGTSEERGYDYEWRKFSKQYRIDNPLCVDCLERGITTPSREVHHIKKVRNFPHLKYEPTNLMPLCSDCHKERTARGE